MATDNMGLVRRFIEEVWNKGDLAVIDELVSEKYVGTEPMIGDVRGLAALRDQVQMFRTAFPDLRITIEDVGMSGDRVFMRWTGRGTHRGALMGIPPSNNRGEVRGISVQRVAGGKIVEQYESYDSLRLMQIIGAVPSMERMGKGQGSGQQAQRPQV